jgi:hypothetical protein
MDCHSMPAAFNLNEPNSRYYPQRDGNIGKIENRPPSQVHEINHGAVKIRLT